MLKEIRCFSDSEWILKSPVTEKELKIPVCYHYLGDMDVGVATKTYYCSKCKTTWSVSQTEDRNLHYTPLKKGTPDRKDYDDTGIVIIE